MTDWAGTFSTVLLIYSLIYLNKHIKKKKWVNSLGLLIASSIISILIGLSIMLVGVEGYIAGQLSYDFWGLTAIGISC